MKNFLFIFFLSCVGSSLFAQSEIAINEWKSYLPYQNVRHIEETEDRILFATEWAILSYTIDEGSFDFLSKVDGLSDTGISEIAYDKNNQQLIIAYANSNIDIVKGNDVINKSDIRDNTNITGDRTINDIHIGENNKMYLSTSFGILEMDLESLEFGQTIFTDAAVNQMDNNGNLLFAATEDGLYSINTGQALNIADFGSWDLMGPELNLPLVYPCEHAAVLEDKVFTMIDDTLKMAVTGGAFQNKYTLPEDFVPRFLRASGGLIALGIYDEVYTSQVIFFDSEGNNLGGPAGCSNLVTDAYISNSGRIWFGDEWNNIRYSESIDAPCSTRKLNTPTTHELSEITIKNDDIYVAAGGVTDTYEALASREGFYEYSNEEWKVYNQNSFPNVGLQDFVNFYRVLPHPQDNILFIASFWGGLVRLDLDTEEFSYSTQFNSALQGRGGTSSTTFVGGLVFDRDNNLWVSNFGAPEPIVVFLNGEGTGISYPVKSASKNLVQITMDDSGYLWAVVSGNPGGIVVYDPGSRAEDPSDDDDRFINLGVRVNTIEVDRSGDVWVGTTEGPYVFECGGSALSEDCVGTQRKVLQDSIAAFLLETENIRAIETDGANRKWFGTKNGIFIQSPDGEDQIMRLTESNSPLFDNEIIDLTFNGNTGEMFIGSNKGIQSVRTETTEGQATHSGNVIAFPNPVRPDYSGPIAIKGLANDAEVKITDIAGKLVYETTALGGQAIWDGNDYNGRRAVSGVYLVFSSSTESFDNPDSYVTKILLMN